MRVWAEYVAKAEWYFGWRYSQVQGAGHASMEPTVGSASDCTEEPVSKSSEVQALLDPAPLACAQVSAASEVAPTATVAQQNGHKPAASTSVTASGLPPPRSAPALAPKPPAARRKMSVMMEEDSSDDLDNDCPNSARSIGSSQADNDSDSTYEERGRLLSAGSISTCRSMRKSLQHIPASHGSQSSRASSRRNSPVAKRSAASTSLDSFHEKSSRSRTNTPPPPRHPLRHLNRESQRQPQQQQQQQPQPTPPPPPPLPHHHHLQLQQQQQQQQQQQRRQLHRPLECSSGSSRRGDSASRHCSRNPSMRSLKSSSASDEHHCASCYPQLQQQQQTALQLYPSKTCASWGSIVFSDPTTTMATRPTDAVSIRSLASIGMGSSDGRKLTIRRVPTSPSELLNMVHPTSTPVEDDLSTCTSYDDGDAEDHSEYRQPRRPHWENKVQFVLACIGYSVGLGNVWRFPYLCYKSGGGVFLIPYFIVLIVCGVPLLYMELSIGQFTRRGPIGALGQICPLFKGAGLSSVVISFIMSTYHNVIIAYAIYYFFTGCKSIQPWSNCDNKWNTPHCWPREENLLSNESRAKVGMRTIPAAEFFDRKVLKISEGIEHPGSLRWELAACLIAAWVIVYFSIWKSIKSSARVRYITATLPFLLIFIFLTRSLTLEGAEQGLQFFFHPNWQLLKDAKVWVNAAAQIFNSVGIAFGSMICFASYNKFHNNILIDAVAVSLINAFSCLLVGIFAFATIGNIAVELNMTVPQVLNDGPGLVFVVYPQALAKMPWSQMWATLFFFMLVCLTLNSQFAIVEVVVTSIQDGFPKWVKKHLMCHEMLVLLVCIVSFLLGLPNVTEGGIYFFQLIDHYAASISIMFLAFFEVIAISWFYGVRRLCSNVKEMTGRAPGIYFRFCWLIAAPLLIMAVWVFSLIDYEPPHYTRNMSVKYQYPWWAEAIGWGIASLSLICIPAFAACVLYRAEGATFTEKLQNSIKSDFEACEVCGQEYCTEPSHSTDDDQLKEPLHEMNNVMVVQTFQPPKTQL